MKRRIYKHYREGKKKGGQHYCEVIDKPNKQDYILCKMPDGMVKRRTFIVGENKYRFKKAPDDFWYHHIDNDKHHDTKSNVILLHKKDHYKVLHKKDHGSARRRKSLIIKLRTVKNEA
jgi:hypothetical protein